MKCAPSAFHPHLGQPVPQRVPGQPEQARGLALVPVGAAQGFADDFLLVLIQAEPFRQKMRVAALRARAGGALQLDVRGVELRARRHHQAALNYVLQLAHVAGPVVRHQFFHGRIGDRFHPAAGIGRQFLQEMVGQKRNVLLALAERRNVERHHVEPVIKVLAKGALFQRGAQVLIGGCDHPHVDMAGHIAAQPLPRSPGSTGVPAPAGERAGADAQLLRLPCNQWVADSSSTPLIRANTTILGWSRQGPPNAG